MSIQYLQMSASQFETNEKQFIATPPNMPPYLLVRFCKLQKSFWHTFLREVTEYYTNETITGKPAEQKDINTPTRKTEGEIPDAPERPRPDSRIVDTQDGSEVIRKLEFTGKPAEQKDINTPTRKTEGEIPDAPERPRPDSRIVDTQDGSEVIRKLEFTGKPAEQKKKKPAGQKKTRTVEEEQVRMEKKKRGPSEYNKFISREVERLRKEDPGLNHKVAFKMAVASWKDHKIPTPTTTIENEPPINPEIDPQNVTLDEVC